MRLRGSTASRTGPTARRSPSAPTTVCVRVLDARTGEELAGTGVGGSAARLAFTGDGSRLVVLDGSPPTIRMLDADTLRPVGSPILPTGFRANYIAVVLPACPLRADPGRPLGDHGVGRGRARLVGSADRAEGAKPGDREGLPRARAQPARSSRRRRHRRWHPAGRRAHREGDDVNCGLQREPERPAVQPGRDVRRVGQPRRDRHAVGHPVGRGHSRRCAGTRTPCSISSSAAAARRSTR